MSKPDIKGLIKLAEYMTNVPRREFNMGSWIDSNPYGTIRCIAGHAVVLFPHRFRKEEYWKSDDGQSSSYDVVHRSTGLKGSLGFAKAFKLQHRDGERITVENNYTTPKAAAKGIMAVVNRLQREMKAVK